MHRNTSIPYRIIDALFRYRALFIISVFVVACGPMAYVLAKKSDYYAAAQTQCSADGLPNGLAKLSDGSNSGYGNNWTSVAQQNVNRFNEWVQDNRPGGFLDKALQNAHLIHPINVDPRVKDPQLRALFTGLKPSADSEFVFTIYLTWADPIECEQIVKAFQAQYIEEVGVSRQAQSKATADFLDGELTRYKERMHVAERALIEFKQQNAGQSPEAQTATISELSNLQNQFDDLQNTSRNSDLKRKVVLDQIARIKPTSILEQHIAASPLMGEIKDLQAKRSGLVVEGWLPGSDRVRSLDSQIDVLQQQLKAESKTNSGTAAGTDKNITETVLQDNPEFQKLNEELTQTTIDSNTQQAEMVQLSEQIKHYQATIAQMPSAEARLNDTTRDYTILKSQYEKLLERREQAQMNTQLDKVAATANLRPIGIVNVEPTTGKTKKAMMLVGLVVLSLVAGFGVTLFAEWADPSLRNAVDLEKRLGVAVLVSVPDSSTTDRLPAYIERDRAGSPRLLPTRDIE